MLNYCLSRVHMDSWQTKGSHPVQASLDSAQGWNLNLPPDTYYTTLFVSKFNTEPVDGVSPFSWLHHSLLAQDGNMDISHRFARNLAQAFFGHYFSLPQVVMTAQAGYGSHLLMLKKLLDVPAMINSEQLVQGILAAVIYELIMETSADAWIKHVLALARVIEVSIAGDDFTITNQCTAEIDQILVPRAHCTSILV
ncbi:MAG: hypothetical protein Q9213_004031 [Squamulea squamosa]